MLGKGLPVEGEVLCLDSHASISVFWKVVGALVRFSLQVLDIDSQQSRQG